MSNEQIDQLKKLIQASEAKLKQSEAQLDNILNEKKLLQETMDLTIKLQDSCGIPRILTKAQLKELENAKKDIALQDKEKLRKNIENITKTEIERAKKIRQEVEGLSQKDKDIAELMALKIESRAFERELDIKSEILREQKAQMENLVAQKAIFDFKIEKLKSKAGLFKSKKHIGELQIQEAGRALNLMVNNRNHILNGYSKLCIDFEAVQLRFLRLKSQLNNCHSKMAKYTDI